MTTLAWDQVGERIYETGVSKGVLYKEDGYGVAWNGLTSIEESMGNEVEPVYFDGVKFNDIVTVGDFAAVVRAFTYPEEFLYYEGTYLEQAGFYVTVNRKVDLVCHTKHELVTILLVQKRDTRSSFIQFNCASAQRDYQTLSLDTEPIEFEWTISAIPEEIENYRPTAHVIFDSRHMDPNMLADLEDIIYGDEDSDAQLPSLKGLATFIRKWDRLIITDNGDGTWTADTQAEDTTTLIMLDDTTFQIISDTAVMLDADSYEISSSEKNEEDLWPQ